MEIMVLVNPCAGKQTILKETQEIEKIFQESGAHVCMIEPQTLEEAQKLISQREERPDLLVCCGGDGTLSAAVNNLLKTNTKVNLGYIPSGSTNDFANTLGVPKNPLQAAKMILNGAPRPLDVGKFSQRYFIYVASFGAFTQASYSAPQSLKNSLGHMAYVIEGLKELPQIKAYHMAVETERKTVEGDYLFGAVSNSTSLAGLFKLDPEAVELDDGLFEITLVKNPRNLLEFHRIVASMLSGKFDPEMITFLHTKRAVFHCEEAIPWSLDGEYAPGTQDVEIQVERAAYTLCY